MTKQAQLIILLKQGDNKAIRDLYNAHRNGFVVFARKYGVAEADSVDVYQDAVVALCEQAKRGRLDDLKSELKTYLFAIGKYMVYAHLKRRNKTVPLTDIGEVPEFLEADSTNEDGDEVAKLGRLFEQLGAQCREILKLFYYEERKLDEIVHIMGYENKDVAKSQKSRCIKQLKTLANKQ